MDYTSYFAPYPALKEEFLAGAQNLTYDSDNPHPLLYLILAKDERTCHIAQRTDKCLANVRNLNPQWLNGKVNIILQSQDLQNVSAILGEIRAYGELAWVWRDKITTPISGADFRVRLPDCVVGVEIYTPQHRTKRHMRIAEEHQSSHITTTMTELFPFGWPERERVDTIQGEAVSQLAQAKAREHQFTNNEISVLWLDLQDPILWSMDFRKEQLLPISAFQETLTSGALWNALYGEKGLEVYDDLSTQGLPPRCYKMEFDGRFNQDTLIDFCIADTRTAHVVFENHRKTEVVPSSVYRGLHNLFKFNLEMSWLDWPNRGTLRMRVEETIKSLRLYKEAFRIPEIA